MRPRIALVAVALAAGTVVPPESSSSVTNRIPPGFTVVAYATTGGTATSLTFGKDTREGADRSAQRLYVADFSGDRVVVIDDAAGQGTTVSTFADGFSAPLGVVGGSDGSLYVADAESTRSGPFGSRPYGRVWRVRDTDGDGVADKKNVVVKDLPNGRHNTNGMAFGPDGMLYVTNGNSTDDGIEGGQPEVVPWSGSVIRVNPKAKGVSLADLPRRKTLVAYGFRNVYDLAFSPLDRSRVFIPMNGADDARKGSTGENPVDPELEDSDDLLYSTDVNDKRAGKSRIEDFGFPSCLYNRAEKGNLKPYDNPNVDVIKKFGKCPRSVSRPESTFGLHPSADGLAFQTTGDWGPAYKNNLFVAEFGSFFGSPPAGHRVVRVRLNKNGTKVVDHESFFETATPLDVTFDRSGALYVASFTGVIFKIDKPLPVPRP